MKKQADATIRIRVGRVAELLSCGKSSVWRWCKERPGFPQPRREGKRYSFWLLSEVESYASRENPTEV